MYGVTENIDIDLNIVLEEYCLKATSNQTDGPKRPEYYDSLAVVYARLGNRDKSLDNFIKFLEEVNEEDPHLKNIIPCRKNIIENLRIGN